MCLNVPLTRNSDVESCDIRSSQRGFQVGPTLGPSISRQSSTTRKGAVAALVAAAFHSYVHFSTSNKSRQILMAVPHLKITRGKKNRARARARGEVVDGTRARRSAGMFESQLAAYHRGTCCPSFFPRSWNRGFRLTWTCSQGMLAEEGVAHAWRCPPSLV